MDDNEALIEVAEFQPLSNGTREDRMLHALEYIAGALSLLIKERAAQHGVGRGGLGT
jgi:hypothetical protein